jgi:hypothetical protein
MKARVIKTEGFTGASVVALAAAINLWLQSGEEKVVLNTQYQFDGASHCALVLYAE